MTDAASAAAHPLLDPWDGPLGAPPLDRFDPAAVVPALAVATARHRAEIDAIATDPRPADFANTLAPLERAGAALSRVRRHFWMLASAHATSAIRAIEAEVGEYLGRHATEIAHDPRLFARVDAVWRRRHDSGLSEEQVRLVEQVHRGFIAGGALLESAPKQRFAAIDDRLQALSVAFGQNVVAAAAAWELWVDAGDLDGLPAGVRASAAARAAAAGAPGRHLFGLGRADFEAVLGFAGARHVREAMWRGFIGRGDGGAHDNRPLITEILALRHERAALLGHASYADYKLDDSMAKTPAAAMALLDRVWAPAHARALAELAELQAFAAARGAGEPLAPWDVRFWMEQVRHAHYDLDGAALRAHLPLDAVRDAAFAAAGRLYGLCFTPRPDLPGYHADVAAWAITDADGAPAGLLYTDYIARPEKHGGAWMGSLRVQERLDGDVLPIVYTVANFAPAPAGETPGLSLDEARTLFHEFGHALHAILSDVTYPSLAGTAVARDFVEFPSKFMEHWIVAPEVLRGFGVPDPLITAVARAGAYGEGIATLEFLASAIVDLALHRSATADWAATEADLLAALAMPEALVMRHRLPHFTHVFDGGYAAAYYSYLWSEVLDADAFEAFEASGDLFDPALAARFRTEILARGDSRDPQASFAAFRGRDPDEGALLRARHLV